MLEQLDGYKTYIIATAIAVITALRFLGVIDQDIFITLIGLLGGSGLFTLRDGIKKLEK